jgi:hypothetical protein
VPEELPEPLPIQSKPKGARPKDPQKVAAGKKGAEARKKKQEALLNQLREAKAHLHNTAVGITGAGGMTSHGATEPTIPVDTHTVRTVETVQTAEHHPSQDPLLWAIGAAALLGGLVWASSMKYGRHEPVQVTPRARDDTPMLNKHRDPFIMH